MSWACGIVPRMTISAAGPTYVQAPGNGVSTVFAFPFKIFQATDLVVGFITSSGYAQQTSGFTVQGVDNNGGGQVTFPTAPPSGTTVDIRSLTPEIQNTEFANLGAFLPETHTEAFDRLTRIVQDLYRLTYVFGIHGPDQEDTPWTTLPVASIRANQALVFDANGLPVPGVVPNVPVTQTLFNTLLQTVSEAVADIFLGITTPYKQTAAEIAAGVTPVNYAYAPGVIDRYGFNTTPGTTDMLGAINNAILVANATTPNGGQVTFLANTYFHSGTITMKQRVILQGAGVGSTVLKSSHTGAGIKLTNPLNTSTPADTSVRDLQLWNTNAGNTDGGYVDLCGTFGELRNVRILGYKYSVILDQSELWDIDRCDFESPLAACVWFVNGADYVGGANPGFTNRIKLSRCQFNNAATTAIIDDGGAAHNIDSCNFNLCVNHLRLAGCVNFELSNCEMEASTGDVIVCATTTAVLGTSVGANALLSFRNNFISPPAGHNVLAVNSAVTSLNFCSNRTITAVPCVIGTSAINTVFAYGNLDSNVGQLFDGVATNHFETAVAEGKFITNGKFGVNGVTSPPTQSTGWGTPTGASVVTSLTCGAGASLTTVSEAVGQIILYLKAKGDFGV